MNYNIILAIAMVCLPYEMEREELRINTMIETITPEIVTLTTYRASEAETDSTPDITASGFKITNPKKHRIIAVSRDLKKKYKFYAEIEPVFSIRSRKIGFSIISPPEPDFCGLAINPLIPHN